MRYHGIELYEAEILLIRVEKDRKQLLRELRFNEVQLFFAKLKLQEISEIEGRKED